MLRIAKPRPAPHSRPDGDESSAEAGLGPPERAWTPLESVHQVEAWMALVDQELRKLADSKSHRYPGIRLTLTHGGCVTLHTTAEGEVWLDVARDAAWVAPVIHAATAAEAPRGAIWVIPGERLIELILGLNSLIASEQLVPHHPFKSR